MCAERHIEVTLCFRVRIINVVVSSEVQFVGWCSGVCQVKLTAGLCSVIYWNSIVFNRGKLILLYGNNRSDTIHKIIYCRLVWAFVYHAVIWSSFLPRVMYCTYLS